MEHRGHGRSGCLGANDNTQINVEDFNYYINDLKLFIDKEVLENNKNELFLFSHSIGGNPMKNSDFFDIAKKHFKYIFIWF